MSESHLEKIREELSVHFDVPTHEISLKLFKQTAESVEKIANEFNKVLFKNSLNVKVYIAPLKKAVFLKI